MLNRNDCTGSTGFMGRCHIGRSLYGHIVLYAAALLLLCSIALPLSGCKGSADPRDDGVTRIVCTVFPAWEFCRAVTEGTDAVVILLSHQGQDLHSFEPSAADMAELARADLLVYTGGASEAWVEGAVRASGNTGLRTVAMMDVCDTMVEEIPEGADTDHDHDHEQQGTQVEYDEHVWTSIRNDVLIVGAVTDVLTGLDPENASTYRAGADAYIAELNTLEAAYADMAASAVRHAILIADRYPFAYLMRDLGLTCYAAFPGCSSESQASFATQIFLVEKVKELNLPCIFTVDNGQGSVAEPVSAQTGAEVLRLWSGQTYQEGLTYLDMLRENLANLKQALA